MPQTSDIQIGSASTAWVQSHSGLGWSAVDVPAIPFDTLDISRSFEDLRQQWHREYGASSSARVIANSSSYKQIIFLGQRVLPLIFRDLECRPEPDHWFTALREITNANPVSENDRGNMRAMAKSWLKWARSNGYTW